MVVPSEYPDRHYFGLLKEETIADKRQVYLINCVPEDLFSDAKVQNMWSKATMLKDAGNVSSITNAVVDVGFLGTCFSWHVEDFDTWR